MNAMTLEPPTQPLRFLRCVVNTATYCLNLAAVRSIQRLEQVRQHAPEPGGKVGVIASSRGALPVYHIATRLGQPAAVPQASAKALILQGSQQAWALLVDRVEGTLEVPRHAVVPLPTMARNPRAPWWDGVITHAGNMYLSLAPAGLAPHATPDAATLRTLATAPEPMPGPGSIPPVPRHTGKLLCFRTGDATVPLTPLLFGLSLSQVVRTQQAPAVLPLPGAAPAVLGLVEWLGVPLTVLDLAHGLGGPPALRQVDDRLLIARAARQCAFVGFLIRPQVTIHTLPMAHRPSTRTLPLRPAFLRGCFELEHDTLVIPDIDRLCQS